MPDFSHLASLFREYDIRGCATHSLTLSVSYHIAQAFGEFLAQHASPPQVCLAYDGRLTSPQLAQAFAQGLCDQGVNVIQLGLGPTPFLYWAEHYLNATAGVMITGSHNCPSDNGVKLTFEKRPFFGTQLQALYQRIQKPFSPQKQGTIDAQQLQALYSQSFEQSHHTLTKPLKIIWDPGNGALGAVLRTALKSLPHTSIILHETVNGTFPHRSPDPTAPGALIHLQETIAKEQADVGLAFDGDGDRLVVVDASGQIWMGDELLVFIAEHEKKPSPTPIIADIKSSPFLLQHLENKGIPVSTVKTGHVHIKKAMQESGSLFGGEVSGHFFFKDTHWGFDDGLYTAFRFIRLLKDKNDLISWRQTLPVRISSPELRLSCPDILKDTILTHLKNYLQEKSIPFQETDGVRVRQDQGWWLVRASQTEPVLVIRWEALTKENYHLIARFLQDFFASWPIAWPALQGALSAVS